MHGTVTYHLLTDSQPVPDQKQPSYPMPPVLLLHVTPYGVGHLCDLSLSALSPPATYTPQLLSGQAARGVQTTLTCSKRCSAATKTSVCYQHYSHTALN